MPRQSKAPVRQLSFVNRRRPTRLPGSRPSEARPDGTAASDLPDRDRVEKAFGEAAERLGSAFDPRRLRRPTCPRHRCRALASSPILIDCRSSSFPKETTSSQRDSSPGHRAALVRSSRTIGKGSPGHQHAPATLLVERATAPIIGPGQPKTCCPYGWPRSYDRSVFG